MGGESRCDQLQCFRGRAVRQGGLLDAACTFVYVLADAARGAQRWWLWRYNGGSRAGGLCSGNAGAQSR